MCIHVYVCILTQYASITIYFIFRNSERDKDLFGYPKPNGIPNQTFPMEATNADVRQLPPPMIIPSRTQVCD